MALNDGQLKEHTLNRTGHGMSPASSALYDQLGFEGYIDWQLDRCSANDIASSLSVTGVPSIGPSGFGREHADIEGVLGRVARSKILRAMTKREQLADVLADFWFNHFNVQCATASSVGFWQIDTIEAKFARHAAGQFRDMLETNAFSHEMMVYLDNVDNDRGSNENLGREILELHTVGINGGYDQDDVVDASRVISGWTGGINYDASPANPVGVLPHTLVESRHSKLAKNVMGVSYPANTAASTEQARFLDNLASHPSTQARLSYKLCQLFIADVPPADIISSTRSTWQATNGDLRAVTRHILLSNAFKDEQFFRTKFKRPRHFVASVARALDRTISQVDDDIGFWKPPDIENFQPTYVNTSLPVSFVERMGEVLFKNGTPTGYNFDTRTWISGVTLGIRLELADYAGKNWLSNLNELQGLNTVDTIDALIETMIPGGMSDETGIAITRHISELGDQARLAEAVSLMLSSPEFGAC